MKYKYSPQKVCTIRSNISAKALIIIGLALSATSVIAQAGQQSSSTQELQGMYVSEPVFPEDNEFLPPAPTLNDNARTSVKEMHLPIRRPIHPQFTPVDTIDSIFDQEPLLEPLPLVPMPAPIRNFEGVNNVNGLLPPDTNGEVGKTRYIQMVNVSMAIYAKNGVRLFGPFLPSRLWPATSPCGKANDGDPVVLYDQLANRWLVSQFALPSFPAAPFYQCIAISKSESADNLPGNWRAYTFKIPNNKINDHPKLAVWPDAYYMSVNQFLPNNDWGGVGAYAFERTKMLSGLPAKLILRDVGTKDLRYGGMLPSDLEGITRPLAGTPNFFVEVDDPFFVGNADALRIWKFHVDWATPVKSTFGLANFQPNFVRNTKPFDYLPCVKTGSSSCIPQKGTSQRLDSLGDRLMFRLTYRKFANRDALFVNHTVKVPGSADRAGIRWYEIRNPNANPTIFQQGLFAPADGLFRWMGSIATDKQGNMALGYSVSSSAIFPCIRYAGRLVSDPLGTLSRTERSIIPGSGAQTHNSGRWGDYSDMTVDPVDNCTFWYTQEYIKTTGAANWRTRIASFKFPGCQ